MKLTYVCLLMCFALIGFTACKKSAPATAASETQGAMDTAKFAQLFQTAAPETRALAGNIQMNIRYQQYPQALANLDKLSSDPGMNDEQKQAVARLTEQVKEAASKPPAQ